jgi:hypothetical protein
VTKSIKTLGLAVAACLIGCTTFYLLLLGMEAYSAWLVSSTLDRIEALRVGDPYSTFERATEGCSRIEATSSGRICSSGAGAFHFSALWKLESKLPEAYRLENLLNKAGLRYWFLTTSGSADNGRIREISTYLYLVGRYEALGTRWELAASIPSRYDQFASTSVDRRTYMGWYHITSMPSGEGFGIYATPASTDQELLARRINRKCFFSFRGCDGLCELLPDAIPVLNERKRSWGGCCGVPRSWCELKNDTCRAFVGQTTAH